MLNPAPTPKPRSTRGRPRKVTPSQEKNISFDQDLVSRVDIVLFSELEGRVPHGAWSKYLSQLIADDLSRRAAAGTGEPLYAETPDFPMEKPEMEESTMVLIYQYRITDHRKIANFAWQSAVDFVFDQFPEIMCSERQLKAYADHTCRLRGGK